MLHIHKSTILWQADIIQFKQLKQSFNTVIRTLKQKLDLLGHSEVIVPIIVFHGLETLCQVLCLI